MQIQKYLFKMFTLSTMISSMLFQQCYNSVIAAERNTLYELSTKSGKVNTWTTSDAKIPVTLRDFGSNVLDNKIYIIGGGNDRGTIDSVKVYDTETKSWETKTSKQVPTEGLASSIIDGKIYCIGGNSHWSTFFDKLEVYDIQSDSWETKASISSQRAYLASSVVDGKIYVMGGFDATTIQFTNKVEMYDPVTDRWETKASMPTARGNLVSSVIDGKIYCIGGYDGESYVDTVEVYDPKTDSWETKKSMLTARGDLSAIMVDDKIYCIGGYAGDEVYLDTVEVYDPKTDSWETKVSMPTARAGLKSVLIKGNIYALGGYTGESFYDVIEIYAAKEPSMEEKALEYVEIAEKTKDLSDIEIARNLVNQLPEGELKTQLQARLNAISPNESLEKKDYTSNMDVYIKSQNMISITMDVNVINFENFSGIEDMEKTNAVNVTVNSSLPYQLNAYLPVEIQNSDKTKTINKEILNIKENSESKYKTFSNINEKLILKDNCISGNDIKHSVDLMLKAGIAHEADVYKTVIKFEVEQK